MTSLAFLLLTPVNVDHDGLSYRGMPLSDLQAAGLPEGVVLAAAKESLKARIDEAAEVLRGRVLTTGSGQALEYQEVQAQANAALKAPSKATANAYPMLAATVGVDVDPETQEPSNDVLGVARSVVAAYAAWNVIGAEIRGARLKGKASVDEAPSIEAAADAFDAIAWPALPT